MYINTEAPQKTPCVAILSNQKCHFFLFFSHTKLEKRRAKWELPRGLGISGRQGGDWEMVKEGVYGENTVYTCM
jgi:hypothetical protein